MDCPCDFITLESITQILTMFDSYQGLGSYFLFLLSLQFPKNLTSWKRFWTWNNIFLANNYQIKLKYLIFYGPYLQRSHFEPFRLRKMVCSLITICGMKENHLEKSCGRGWLNLGCWNDNIFWIKSKRT